LSDAGRRVHGGIDARELARLEIEPGDVLDLSVNVNPLGPHPQVVQAVQRAALDRYPDPDASLARAALARSEDIDPARILVGHGSAELLWSLVSTLAGGSRPLLVATPTFSEPEAAAHAWRVPVVSVRSRESDAFALDVSALAGAIREHRPGAVYLCQPNNPDGGALAPAELRALFEAHPQQLFILDQAFLSLSLRHAEQRVRYGDNVVLVRSLTKDHALPGLRVGYALAAPERIRELAARRPSWMVSAPAQAAIVAACEHADHVQAARAFWLNATAALADACTRLGMAVLPSLTPYFLLRVEDADGLRQRLLIRHRILLRSCASFGLPHHVRIAGCGPAERARFLLALREEWRP
jgi:histidinol-phosphate/aromatic aminotransferase/cobyric acid decarboxylase-like protein